MRFCTKRGVILVANSVGNLLPQMAYSLTLNNGDFCVEIYALKYFYFSEDD